MMGIDQVSSDLLRTSVEGGSTFWARITEVQTSPNGDVLTAKYLTIDTGEELLVDVNTVKNGILRVLSEGFTVNREIQETVGLLTKHSNSPGELSVIDWDAAVADVCVQAGLFSEVRY